MINNGKASIDNSGAALSLSIPSKKNWFALIFGTVWLGGWYFGFNMASSVLLSGKSNSGAAGGFMTFWIIAWTIGGLFFITLLLWGYFGKEEFVSDRGEVRLNKTVFGIGIKKKMIANEINNIRMEVVNTNAFGGNNWAFWGLGPGKIKFDYGYKTYSFGLGVDDAEANHIVALMKQYFKQ